MISALDVKAQDPDSFHICYFSLNNQHEFTEMEKFTKKLNEHSSHPISVKEYMTEGGLPEDSFKKMVEEDVRCDGLVISGHHTGAFGGKRASGSLNVSFLEKMSCDEKYSNWFKNIQALWLQGCRTLGTGEVVPDQQEETSADHHTLRVGNVLEEDHLEQSLVDLDMEFSATLDQDNPLSSRYLRVFPAATVFGWTKTAPGEKAGSQYSIPFHIAHIARLNSKTDQFPTSKPLDKTLDQGSALQYTESLLNLLNRRDMDNECEDVSIEAWKKHGNVQNQRTELGFLNPDLNAHPALTQSDDDLLKQARLLDCLLNNAKDEESLLKAIDEILKDPKLIHYTFNSLLDKLKTLKQDQPNLHKKILDKLKSNSKMNEFLAQKLNSPSLGILRKIDYFAFYEELYGKSDPIRSHLLDQSIKILKSTQSDDSYDVIDYKITLLQSLDKHGYLTHPKGLSVLEQAMKDSDIAVRVEAVEAAGKIGESALSLVEQAINDSDTSIKVRMEAVYAAGKIGEAALPLVEKAMNDKNLEVRREAVRAAGKIGEAALPLVEKAMNNSDQQYVRLQAVTAAGEIGEPALPLMQSTGLPLLEKLMEDSDRYVRRSAVSSAGEIGEVALPLLEKAMNNSDISMREEAVEAAGKIGKAALPLLEQAMNDSNKDVRLEAVYAAGEIGEPALPLIEQAMNDSNTDVRLQAVEKAGKMGEPARSLIQSKGLPVLEKAMNNKDEFIRLRAAKTVGEIGGARVLPLVEKAMNDTDQYVRLTAVAAAGKMGNPARSLIQSKGLPILEKAMNDSDSNVRWRAVKAAGEIGEAALPLLRRLLEDENTPRNTKRDIEKAIRQIN